MTLYTLSQLTKTYKTRTVLDIPFLEIEQGKIYALLGPNGAGKTTLLNILGFLEPPTTGDILFRSHSVEFAESGLQRLRKEVVLVDQGPLLFTTTVYKNVEFGLKVRKIPKKEREKIIEEVLERVGLRHFSHAPAHRLSGGETQRVALARALAVSPHVLLCDEPTGSVDVENQAAILQILKQINGEKKITILFTTHDRSQADSLAHHTLFLDHGKLSAPFYENLFPAVLHPDGKDQVRCVIRDALTLSLPSYRLGNTIGKVRIVIDPKKLFLAWAGNENGSQHALEGRLIQVVEEKESIRMKVDLGMEVFLLLPKETYFKNPPRVGDRVGVIVPPESIRVV